MSFLSQGSLEHLLKPFQYYSAEQHLSEMRLLQTCWQLVGTTSQLANPGDFLTCELLGVPIQLRNFKGSLRAFSNVCAHRHCLLTDKTCGNSQSMRCQYHGWEYGSSGRPCKIPAPHNFVPFSKDIQLPQYRVECAGQLVFVNLSESGPSLEEQLGELYPVCVEQFGPNRKAYLNWSRNYPANWKVPVENSLEAYHVPCVHPNTFGEDPGESRSHHTIGERLTSFKTQLPFAHSRLDNLVQHSESWVIRRLGMPTTGEYAQYHVFPNLLFSFTEAISLCQCVTPTSPTRSRSIVRQFGAVGQTMGHHILAESWGRFKAAITAKVLKEDLDLFASIQQGLEGSPHRGILGRCEERIFAFQRYLLNQLA